jgi:hypothetical protein
MNSLTIFFLHLTVTELISLQNWYPWAGQLEFDAGQGYDE